MFPSDTTLKIEAAKRFAANCEERPTLNERMMILGALDRLGVVHGQIESTATYIKLRLKELELAEIHEQEILMAMRKDRQERRMQNEKDRQGERRMQNENKDLGGERGMQNEKKDRLGMRRMQNESRSMLRTNVGLLVGDGILRLILSRG